jgi:hypothetical protein
MSSLIWDGRFLPQNQPSPSLAQKPVNLFVCIRRIDAFILGIHAGPLHRRCFLWRESRRAPHNTRLFVGIKNKFGCAVLVHGLHVHNTFTKSAIVVIAFSGHV